MRSNRTRSLIGASVGVWRVRSWLGLAVVLTGGAAALVIGSI